MSVEFVGIELELRGEEGVYNDLKKIDSVINSLRGKKKLDMGLNTLKRDLVAARGELEKLQRERTKLLKAEKEAQRAANAEMTRMNNLYNKWGSGFKNSAASKFLKDNVREANRARLEAEKAVQGNAAAIDAAKMRVKDLNQAMREVQASARAMGKTFQQSFNRANSVITHIGSKMQSLGNAMTRLSTPFTRLTTGFVMGAGYKALNTVTEGLSRGFTRYDTMKKYPKIMAAFGYSAKEAKDSIDALDMSVRGLPTGLDEMVDLAQRFTATTGDIQKGTKLAIATNNAFLASMSTDTQKYQGMMQLQDVLGGKDMNSREWNSLVSSMTPAITKMGEYLKKQGEWNGSIGEFIQHVRDGQMANEDFIDTLIKIGNEGGVLEAMAQESKDTWAAFFANVGNASARMAEGVIKAFDEISRQAFGKDLNMLFIDNIIPAIDNMAKSVQGWIKAHPQEILNFFNDLKSIDWTGLIKGFAQGTMEMAKMLTTLAKTFGGGDLSKFGRNLIRMSWLGRGITVLGGVLKGTSGFLATIYATTKTLKRAKGAGSLLDAIGVLLGDKGGDVGKAAEKMTKAGGSMGKFSLGLSNFFRGWAQIATMIGGSAFVAWGSMKLFKGTVKSFKDMVDTLNEVDWDMGAKALGGIGVFLTAVAGLSALAGKFAGASGTLLVGEVIVGLFTTLAVGFADLDMYFIKDTAKNARDAIDYLNQAIEKLGEVKEVPNVKKKIGKAIKSLNEITNLFRGDFNPDTKQYEGGLRYFGKKYANSMKNLENALTSVDAINKLKIDSSNIETNMTALGDALESIGTMLEDMPTTLKGEQSQTWSNNVKVAMQNVHEAFKSLTAGDGILTQIPMITGAIHNLNKDVIETEFKKLGEIFDIISGNMEGVGADLTFSKRISNFRAALKSMKYAIGHLNQIGQMEVNPQGAENIKSALKQLGNAFDDAGMENITTQIQDFVKSIDDALKQFDKFNKTIVLKTKVKLGGGFSSSVSAAVSKIRKAGRDIQSAVDSIPSEITKNVTVRIVVNAIVSGMDKVRSVAQEALSAAGKANGGMIYRSNGGSIYRANGGGIGFPGKPQGADRIPVWAQAGEFMQSKRAVNFFGIDFMRKVNSLDIKGAMDELMIRAGNMVGAGQSTTINNYNYNNNQKVVQNINTNSPDFAFRTASRFVGAF